MYNICQINKQAKILMNVLYTAFHKMFSFSQRNMIQNFAFLKGVLQLSPLSSVSKKVIQVILIIQSII